MADTNYTVLKEKKLSELKELPDSTTVFLPLGTVNAANGQTAIVEMTKGKTPAEKNGNFAAPSTRNFPVIPRYVKMVEDDSFGEPRSVQVSAASAEKSE